MKRSKPRSDVDAQQLLRCAEDCVGAIDRAGEYASGILAGHALEAALKAYLALKGWDEKRLRGLSHDLLATWSAAVAERLDIWAEPPRWVRGLAYMHGNLLYRYPASTSGLWSPPGDRLRDVLDIVLEAVRKAFPPPPPPPKWDEDLPF